MKVAVAGYGVEGQASYRYWSQQAEVTIVDERQEISSPDGATTMLGEGAFSRLAEFDLIVRSPGVSPHKLPYQGKVSSATNEFFEQCREKNISIIGVTGTKGKGTTCSLIVAMLKAADLNVHLVGNIGTPALDELANIHTGDLVVYELSSFQLWDLRYSPHVAVVLPIEADHLDVHADFNDYLAAKSNIAKYQTEGDVMIYNSTNIWSRQIAASSPANNLIEYPFDLGELVQQLQLPGQHNRENAAAAVAAARRFVTDERAIARGLASFHGLDHRLKLIGEHAGVDYYDDSISTTPGSAIAAIKSFPQPKVIMLGGSDKGADYSEIVELAASSQTTVIAMGQTGRTIESLCQESGVECYYVEDMNSAVIMASQIAKPGDVVLLSPASASFDQYRSYIDRGEQFIAAVRRMQVQ